MHGNDYTAPHWSSSALVLIDVQNDFIVGPSSISGTAELIDGLQWKEGR